MLKICVNRFLAFFGVLLFCILVSTPGWSTETPAPPSIETQDLGQSSGEQPTVDTVLGQVQARYGVSGFCSEFSQVATLTGMGIQDTASGHACFKYPDKMRWEYELPENQVIVSDGQTLWVYRPLDNQVLTGDSKAFFGAGEGASFLTDVKILKSRFEVDWAEQAWQHAAGLQNAWALKLTPKAQNPDFVVLYLLIDKKGHEIFETASFNNFGDETRISFAKPDFGAAPEDSEFVLTIPEGVDVMEMSAALDGE
ncbi:MAG: outer membrane lipoprotein carrier protein LolA [Desulfatibacillum sp.]|nr:outer membrane lipoprotein carrier protein LolA [Desulfatibacillum sp.]